MIDHYDKILERFKNSKFRSKFHLSDKDKQYIEEKGLDKIAEHAEQFIIRRLKFKPTNDGKQTPYKGHPVFVAQHATGICCRKCISKWHKIPRDKKLNEFEIDYLKKVLMKFIEKEYERKD